MNKYLISTVVIVLMSVPAIVGAQTLIDTTTATGISNTIDATGAQVPMNIRQKVQAQYGANMQNVKTNQQIRDNLTSNPPVKAKGINPPDDKIPPSLRTTKTNLTPEERAQISSTTKAEALRRQTVQKNENAALRSMRIEQYKDRKTTVVRHFRIAIDNLLQIRERVSTRMDKEKQNGRDMSKASALLNTADAKINAAKQSVAALEAYLPTATSNDQTVSLDTTRDMIRSTQNSIHEAKVSIHDVVVAIAQAMGLKTGQNRIATSTTPTISNTSASIVPTN